METQKVTFPMLTDVEIVECFKELGVSQLTVQNLTKPEPEFIYALYENVVQKLMGIAADEMARPVYEPYTDLGHPQLYDGAIYQLTFLRNLFKVMRAAGVEFKLVDLLAPTYQRTRRFLSGIINFAKYREEKFSKFEETDQEGERLEEEQLMAEDANHAAAEDLASVRAEISAEEPQMRELTTQLGTVGEQMEHWKRELELAQYQQQQLDKELEKYGRRNERAVGQITELERTKADLMRRVIPDPDRELRLLEDLRARLAKEEELLANAQKLRADRTARRDHLEKSRKAVVKAVALSQDISETLDHVNAERRTIKEYKASIAKEEDNLRELDVNAERVETQLEKLKERTQQAQSEQTKMKDEKMRQMEETRSRKLAVEREHAEVLAQIKELDLEIAKLETEEISLIRGHQERTQLTKTNILALISQVRSYQSCIHSAMRDTMQAQQDALVKQHHLHMSTETAQ